MISKERREPHLWEAIVSLLSLVVGIMLPFNFFCWLSPLVTLVYGWAGWTISPLDESDAKAVDTDASPAN